MKQIDINNGNDFLEHHGIKNMRWGQRRFQNPDGTLTAAGKARYNVSKSGQLVKKTRAQKKAYKKRVESLKKAQEAKKRKDTIRKKVLEDNDLQTAEEHTNMFTTKEIQDINTRAEAIQKLHENHVNQINRGADWVKSAGTYAGNIATLGTNLNNVYKLGNSEVVQAAKEWLNNQK